MISSPGLSSGGRRNPVSVVGIHLVDGEHFYSDVLQRVVSLFYHLLNLQLGRLDNLFGGRVNPEILLGHLRRPLIEITHRIIGGIVLIGVRSTHVEGR